MKKYNFKIRFNNEYKKTPDLCWRCLIDNKEYLLKDIIIEGIEVKTTTHFLDSGEQKWSIYCESDTYTITEDNVLIIK